MVAQQRKTPRDLNSYWRMEAANVLLVPGVALALGCPRHLLEAVALGSAILPAAGFLIVGAAYWRGVDRRVKFGDRAGATRSLELADRGEVPLLVASAVAVALALAAWSVHGWSRSVVAATVLTVLALLEYVNYYHRQLQHFDNLADLRRLITGRGLKRSHMARDLRTSRGATQSAGKRIAD